MGTANIATGAPLSGDAVFYVGSLAKQFVAACVALLWRDGVLDLYRTDRAPTSPGSRRGASGSTSSI